MNSTEAPQLQRISASMRIFHLAILIFAAAVYVGIYKYIWRFVSYPIELEWREGAFWIHALAQSYGINIFESEKIAYVTANHGILDHIIKGALARAFRFLEPQYIARSFVLLFPAISLFSIFTQSRKKLPATSALVTALCLGGAMLITLHDIGHWNTCIGRTDSTAFTLLSIAYLCYSVPSSTRLSGLVRHFSYLAIALTFSTNWKWYPVALMIPIIMEQHHEALRIRELFRIYLLIAGYTLGTCVLFIAIWFHGDALMYYHYFYGFFGGKSPWPQGGATLQTMIKYVRTPTLPFFILLSVIPVFIETWRLIFKRSGNWPKTLAAIATLISFLISALALKINFQGGGYWYLCPQAIILVIYYNTRYKIKPEVASAVLVLSLGIYSQSQNLPLMKWYYRQLGETLPAAREYTEKLTLLDQAFGVYSEEAFLFKRSGPLPPIDMGDFAEACAKSDYFGPRFTSIFSKEQAKVIAHEPILVFVGGCASSAFKQLAENEEYHLFLKSPAPAIGGAVYVRLDHIEEVQRFLKSHAEVSP